LDYEQKSHAYDSSNHFENENDLHAGDITLLRGDENGNAYMKKLNPRISLYGNHAVFGRMGDIHFAKSCYYPGGWDGKFNDFKDNVGENDKNSNIESAEAQNDPQGRSENT